MPSPKGWVEDIIGALQQLGGTATYEDLYPRIKLIRESKGHTWGPQSDAVVRGRIQENSSQTKSFKGKDIFYSVNGLGNGAWGLLPEYFLPDEKQNIYESAYKEGAEGIVSEGRYLRRSRNPRLVEERKKLDNYICQACEFRLELDANKFVIEVHHLNPIGNIKDVVITKIEDLICLCPNCHRIAHSRSKIPLSLNEIKAVIKGY